MGSRGSETLRLWLATSDTTQAELAQTLGSTQASVSRWLAGGAPTSAAQLAKLEQLCGVSVVWWSEPAESTRDVDPHALKGLTPGVDENSSEMADYIGTVRIASEKTGCCVALNHHAGKTPQDGSKRAALQDARAKLEERATAAQEKQAEGRVRAEVVLAPPGVAK